MRPSEWIERHLHIEGKPFRFHTETGSRNHLPPIYDQAHPFVLLKTARGCEKSTTICNKIVFNSSINKGYKTLYVNPSPQQITDFVVQQMVPRLRSPWIKKHMIDRSCIDNITLKTLTNGSVIFMRNVLESPDRVRGIRAYTLTLDEIQDLVYKHIPVLEETLFSSSTFQKQRLYAGTPKTFDNSIQYLWEHSSQNMWHVPCLSCGYLDNTMDSIKNIGKTGPICIKCGKRITPHNGVWIAHNKEKGEMINGFHFNQIMLPWAYANKEAWDQILFKLETYGSAEFHNEVLGVSFDNADKPITEAELRACAVGKFYEHPDQRHLHMPTFMGIDWGYNQSKTVAVIGAKIDDRLQILHFKEFPGYLYPTQDHVVDGMLKLIKEWNITRIASDWGFGFAQNQRIRQYVDDDRFYEFFNSASLKGLARFGATEDKYTINYVVTLTSLFLAFKQQQIILPSGPELDTYIRHFMNIHTEYSSHTRKMLYTNGPDRPDDYCHATNYMRIMSMIYYGDINPAVGA